MDMGIIYLITNNLNKKVYIGKTIRSLQTRWSEHLRDMHNPQKDNKLYRAMNKYGSDNFIIEILKYLKISDLFDFISAPESDRAPESKTALVERAVTVLNVDKSKTVMIGDRYFDIEGAREAKVDSIGVTFGFGDKDELIKSGADYIADSTGDIRRIIFS